MQQAYNHFRGRQVLKGSPVCMALFWSCSAPLLGLALAASLVRVWSQPTSDSMCRSSKQALRHTA